MITPDRPSYDELEARFGPSVGVEDARAHWGSLVKAARNGWITLITRERWEWAALVPLSEVSGLLSGLPLVPLSTARSKLGDLVRQVAQPYEDLPVLLGRHRTPVAGLVAARRLLAGPASPHRPGADELLSDGTTIVLTRLVDGMVTAVARDPAGNEMAAGTGGDVNEALRALADSGTGGTRQGRE